MLQATTEQVQCEDTVYFGWTINDGDDFLACIPDFLSAAERDASLVRHMGMWSKGQLCSVDGILHVFTKA